MIVTADLITVFHVQNMMTKLYWFWVPQFMLYISYGLYTHSYSTVMISYKYYLNTITRTVSKHAATVM